MLGLILNVCVSYKRSMWLRSLMSLLSIFLISLLICFFSAGQIEALFLLLLYYSCTHTHCAFVLMRAEYKIIVSSLLPRQWSTSEDRPQCVVHHDGVSLQSWATMALSFIALLFIFGFPPYS